MVRLGHSRPRARHLHSAVPSTQSGAFLLPGSFRLYYLGPPLEGELAFLLQRPLPQGPWEWSESLIPLQSLS